MLIKVKVVPSAKKERIEKIDDYIKVYLTQPPLDGRANKRLIELLAEYLKVKKYHLSIVKGGKGREKIISLNEVS
ncbi:MAG: DUF167 domain-containing protein [Candidatus Omnitrophica bacterium]|nr:DUF167 domain-containing protein [Candidatus Omnitrophota bacterium]